MPWYPGATRIELKPESSQPHIQPTQLILHSIVAPWSPRRLYEYWANSTSLESHFGLGYSGDLAQYLPTTIRADANAAANRRPDGTGAISVETASNTSASDPWTDEQAEELIALGIWVHREHNVPLRICRTASDPGYGVHKLHRAWSTSGTACPGPKRADQFVHDIFPEIVRGAGGSQSGGGTYTVRSGDTLSSIALGFKGVTWQDIARANRLTEPYVIHPGQRLTIPAGGKTAPATPPPKPVVDLSRLREAARTDPAKRGTAVSYSGAQVVELALVAEGLLSRSYADGHFGTATVRAYAQWQQRLGYTGTAADGVPGKTSLTNLGNRRGFTVKD
ncbi:LysM peptidoglycan-binding domain-containing protein [Streptomyces sp. NBC_01803]|uniref:LysM peptidoglycan-binding domain-containing protein n=1 Tax=Streptomyces sp. NBC_01803 TaxID=2975946 RepID=UPI002DDA1FF8|nr:LysM peptidoglycan-binding domain-containing protein [Streptomyces sp. NBC_01803]WSA44979.1 LysM peptidoglycan-binding domain-containing protein [Streptomyces sp. NBC_01803]